VINASDSLPGGAFPKKKKTDLKKSNFHNKLRRLITVSRARIQEVLAGT
jgi:hypothetical protein